MSRKLLVIGAHSADFVWRAGGAIAVAAAGGGEARVLALSYGEQGESGELWKEPGMTVERVKELRAGEAERAAAALGASFECLDLGDYPLVIGKDGLNRIAEKIRELAPDVLLTHTDRDPFNPDHAEAFSAVEKARALAAGAGTASAFGGPFQPPELLLFEPHQPELCNFVPTVFVDITPVMDAKRAAMAEMKAQAHLHAYYEQLAARRGNHARRSGGASSIEYAEAFQRVTPQVVSRTLNGARSFARAGRRLRERRRRPRGGRPLARRRHRAGPGRPRLACRRPGADGPLRPGRQFDGARRDRRSRSGGGARPDACRSPGRSRSSATCSPRRRRDVESPDCSSTPPSATSRSSASWACPSGRATSAFAAPRRRCPARSASRSRSAERRSVRATSSSWTPTARSWSSTSGSSEVLAAARQRAEREHDKRAKLQAGALSYDLDGLRALVET